MKSYDPNMKLKTKSHKPVKKDEIHLLCLIVDVNIRIKTNLEDFLSTISNPVALAPQQRTA